MWKNKLFNLKTQKFFFMACLCVGVAVITLNRHRIQSLWAPPAQRAFYFWKTQWRSNPVIEESLQKYKISRLYLRFFDVEWDVYKNQSYPLSPIEFQSELPQNVDIVPVVYITNNVFLRTDYAKVEELALRVFTKIKTLANSQKLSFKQIQIDCDWTSRSRKNYFHFLELLKGKVLPSNVLLSSTIRLHQIKYALRTGIPPVDCGMLMFYNFGRIQAESPRSSIFNEKDAKLYSPYISQYSLPLDLVLPIFSWTIHSRDGKVLELLDIANYDELIQNGFERKSPLQFVAKRSFFFHGKYFSEGDLLSVEESNSENTQQAAQLALKGTAWKKHFQTVAFFDLDERNIRRYEKNEIENIYKKF